jgi:phage FluMu gp28-like protein
MITPLSKSDAIEALREQVRAAADRSTNPLHSADLESLRDQSSTHPLAANANKWRNPFPPENPKSQLLQYQFEYWHDASRFKAWLASRQVGKDFSSEGEASEDCQLQTRTTWMVAAPSERQSLDSLEQHKMWAEAFGLVVTDFEEKRDGSEALLKSAEIRYHNGSKCVAVPGRPDTVRGKSANILLTEFDFFDDPLSTWRAILPSITNPLRGGEKKVRIISTPNGKGRMMDKIFNEPAKGKMTWSKHITTIHHAVLMGLPVDIEQIRAAMDDEEGFAQEFEVQFLDGSNVLLPYDIIALAESFDATEKWDFLSTSSTTQQRTFLGIDFGRSNDPTVCWTLERVGDILWTREVLVLDNTPTPEQERILSARIAAANRVCFDYTGPGIGLGDYMVHTHGEWDPSKHKMGKVELCTFTTALKRELFPKLRRAFEAPTKLRIPVSRTIREDLHQMQQQITNGEYNYWSPRTKSGHSDRCTALALAVRAADGPTAAFSSSKVNPAKGRQSRLARFLGW